MRELSRSIVDRVPSRLRAPVELVVRTAEDSVEDRVPGLAAEIAFYTLLSLPPLLLAVLGSVGFVGQRLGAGFQETAVDRLLTLAATVLTSETIQDLGLRGVVTELVTEGRADIASIGFLIAIYSASRAIRVVLVALTIAYDLEDRRPAWKQRLWGFGLTFVVILAGLVIVPVLIVGPGFGEVIDNWIGLGGVVATLWRVLYWPAAIVLTVLAATSLYHFSAPWTTPWRRDLPGAVMAVALWIAGSAGLRLYAQLSIQGRSTYAPFAGPLVLLLWVYVSAFAVLLGAEINAEIEKMWPTLGRRHRAERAEPPPDVRADSRR